jgi:hypothetical protein
MKRFTTVLCAILLFACAVPIASAVEISLFEGYVKVDGLTTDLVNDLSFNIGTITVSFPLGSAGSHFVGVYVDYEIDELINTFYNEYGAVTVASPPDGLSWEIDEPGFVYGDIDDNFMAAPPTLDNMNGVPMDAPDDVAMALGWDFLLGADETATIVFHLTTKQPAPGSFYLAQIDPDSQATLYMYTEFNPSGGPGVIPEPGTWVLLLTGLTLTGAISIRRGRRAPHRRS